MQYLTAAYLLIICILMPLYMKNGYFELGEAKGNAYILIGTIASALLAAGWLVKLVFMLIRKQKPEPIRERRLPMFFLLTFLAANVISLIFAVDKDVAFHGLDGWRTGFITWFFCMFTALFLAYYGAGSEITRPYITAVAVTVPFLMFLMGIVNRFGIYPIEIYGQNNSYLATLGNINWYSGFLSVFVPIGVGFCFISKRFSPKFFFWAVYELFGIIVLFLQGSESALMIVAGTFLILLFCGFKDRNSFKNAMLSSFILGLGMEIAGLLYLGFKDSYTYEDSLLILSCSRHLGLIIMALCLVFYRVSRLFEEIKVTFFGKIYRIVLGVATAALLVFSVVYLVKNFSDDFGNARGIIWRLSAMAFASETPWQKLVGVGQDCFHAYAQSQEEVAACIREAFGGSRLTNAHCESLTVLIQTGVLGITAYLGLLGTMVFSLVKQFEKEDKSIGIVFALPVAAYFLNSLLSFPQSTSTPYLFACIGLGLYTLKSRT